MPFGHPHTLIDFLKENGSPATSALLIFVFSIIFGAYIHRSQKRKEFYAAYFVLSALPLLMGLLGFSISTYNSLSYVSNTALGFSVDLLVMTVWVYIPLVVVSLAQTIMLLIIGFLLLILRVSPTKKANKTVEATPLRSVPHLDRSTEE
jgi:hypothetical protein